MTHAVDAVVIGAGPNGLAAAITLAEAGCRVVVLEAAMTPGGGARSAELTLPGFVHDVCSAVHPLAAASPFLRRLPFTEHGLRLLQPELPLAHPLDGGRAAVLHRGVGTTAAAFGTADGSAYRHLLERAVAESKALFEEVLAPPIHLPRHPLTLARFGLRGLLPVTTLAARLVGEEPRALLGGMAAHSMLPLTTPTTGAMALVLAIAGHAVGWPIVEGGSQAITTALVAHLRSLGGEIVTDHPVTDLAEVPPCRAVLADLTPRQLIAIAGDRLPPTYVARLQRYRYGPAAFKADYALSRAVPWTHPDCRRAGTVHLGGSLDEIVASEGPLAEGRVAARPFVIVAQQSLVDGSRAPAGQHTLWAYCHVPLGSTADMTDAIEAQIERFAPGFEATVLARRVTTPADLEAYNPNCVGGDINGGSAIPRQLFTRPVARWSPYTTPNPRLFICSASSPPGGGVHGMCGHNAARAALRRGLMRRTPARL